MTQSIPFADGLSFPLDVVTEKLAFLARSGAGKSYAAGKLVEGLLDAEAQVVIVDPVGVWYGLRLGRDGKSPGFSIPVLGGEHGDIPLESTSGALLAKLVADTRASMVLDVSSMTGDEMRQFVADFATALLRAKKTARSPVLIVWEECQDFVPQKSSKGRTGTMVAAMERLVKQGRNFGIGTALISQRPQAVAKDVLNQTEVLILLQTTGPQERKAIKGWVDENAFMQASQLDALPSLPIGTAFVWSPGWLRRFDKVKVGPKRTFDASRTPTSAEAVRKAGALAPVDLDALRSDMAATIEKAKADDPKELRKRIAELEARVRAAEARKPEPVIQRVSVLTDDDVAKLRVLVADLDAAGRRACDQASALLASVDRAKAPWEVERRAHAPAETRVARRGDLRPVAVRAARAPAASSGDTLSGPERKLLTALAQHGRMPKVRLALLTGYSHQGGAFKNPLGAMRGRGLVEYHGDEVDVTSAGLGALGDYEPLPTGRALLDRWLAQLPGPESKILRALADAYPDPLDVDELASRAGYDPNGGAFKNPLGRLRTLELATRGRPVRASEALFG